jgi:hypothetical protein
MDTKQLSTQQDALSARRTKIGATAPYVMRSGQYKKNWKIAYSFKSSRLNAYSVRCMLHGTASESVRREVLMTVKLSIEVRWVATPCAPVRW